MTQVDFHLQTPQDDMKSKDFGSLLIFVSPEMPANDWDPMAGFLNGLWGKISGQPRVIKPEVLEYYWSARRAQPMASQDLRSTDLKLT